MRGGKLADIAKVYEIKNSSGLKFSIFENGVVKNIEQNLIQINLTDDSLLEKGCSNLYLRKKTNGKISAVPLLGPASSAKKFIDENNYQFKGEFEGIKFSGRLLLTEKSGCWLWNVQLQNTNKDEQDVDLVYVQDVGLSCADGNEKNESYISQYTDYKPLNHKEIGYVVCCRQNEHGPGCVPWLALGSIGKTKSFSTDGMQFFGTSYRATGLAEALSQSEFGRLSQQELGLIALQAEPVLLKSGQEKDFGFFGIFHKDHPAATTQDDLKLIEPDLQDIKKLAQKPWQDNCAYVESVGSLFSQSPLFASEDLTDEELNKLFGSDRRHSEFCNGQLLSFFYGDDNRHVVLRRKELIVQRHHGHIMKTGNSLTPDDAIMCCTSYMFGVFQSHIAQGNVSFNRFLTVNTNSLNIPRHTGQRIFVRQNERYYQLGIPSAFEMSLNQCRWIYKKGDLMFEVLSLASQDSPEITLKLRILQGQEPEWLISSNLTAEHNWQIVSEEKNSLKILPGEKSELARMFPGGFFGVRLENTKGVKQTGGDELLFADGKSRGLSFLVMTLAQTKQFTMRIEGRLAPSASCGTEAETEKAISFSFDLSSVKANTAISPISEILPWFEQNAQIHYLVSHGLEQYGGAAWGTRDTCQGPIEMLLAQGHYSAVRKILSVIFSNQNTDGNWSQWWMFDGYKKIRAGESHGDVIFWPVLAMSEYICASSDYDFLNESLPYYDGKSESETVIEHINRIIKHIKDTRFVSGTNLVNYSNGDWNDSMQPANPELKKRLISSWTVCLSYQAFRSFGKVCQQSGRNEIAEEMGRLCDAIQKDFSRLLIKDGVVAGFGLVGDKDKIDLLLHPSDSTTGIHYRLLPMTRGILSGIFTPEQAKAHAEIIEKHLKGPDGARLMDKPVKYNGGLQTYFKRAESSSFFGREIGLMYTHAHLRYAEAMARLGHAKSFIKALRQVIPIDIQQIIPQADIRQSNCYYTSSDGDFASRYEVNDHYEDLLAGKVALKGGWRVYSSGPGIFVKFIIAYLLGIRYNCGHTIFDPVLSKEFDGLAAQMKLHGHNVKLVYSVSGKNDGVKKIEINGAGVEFERESNPYRTGGASIEDSKLKMALNKNSNTIKISF
ncbi:MAG: hypothetical protein KJ648_06760 [Candidatus Omnitrophica bacterium]|nr:hypothetical protein [Candidatus Omnitrophota bacterium]